MKETYSKENLSNLIDDTISKSVEVENLLDELDRSNKITQEELDCVFYMNVNLDVLSNKSRLLMNSVNSLIAQETEYLNQVRRREEAYAKWERLPRLYKWILNVFG